MCITSGCVSQALEGVQAEGRLRRRREALEVAMKRLVKLKLKMEAFAPEQKVWHLR